MGPLPPEPLGPTTVIHLRVDGLPGRQMRLVAPPDASFAPDEQVCFRVNVERLHLFDERTGLRISRTE
jgi:hypothetical protein